MEVLLLETHKMALAVAVVTVVIEVQLLSKSNFDLIPGTNTSSCELDFPVRT